MVHEYTSTHTKASEKVNRDNCDSTQGGDSPRVPRPRTDPALKRAIGANIRKFRELRNLKQTDLADLVNVRAVTMWRYEDGRVLPGALMLSRIAEALGVPVAALKTVGGPLPPGLDGADAQPPLPSSPDTPLGAQQQLQKFDELGVDPRIRRAWALHMQQWGAYQQITAGYIARFVEGANLEIAAGATAYAQIAERAGEYAFNAAVDAHARRGKHRRRSRKG